jgi:hypothetical protein
MGWPYFSWSAGYDTDKRGKIMEKIYTSKNKTEICLLLKQNSIDYFTTENTQGNPDLPNIDVEFFNKMFNSQYNDQRLQIFETSENCRNI